MKKLFLLFFMTLLPMLVSAYDFQIGDFCYTITSANDRTVFVEAASKDLKGDIVIPSTVTYNDVVFTVTSISGEGFSSCYNISSLTIPGTIVDISERALGWMWYLETLIFDNPQPISVSGYGFNYDWRAFKTVKIINSDEKEKLNMGLDFLCLLPSHELYINDKLVEDYKVPDGTENVGVMFANCNTLKSIELPNSVKTIGSNAAINCTSLNTITLSSSLEKIGSGAFFDCPELRTIYSKSTIPPSIYYETFPNGAYMFANVYVPKGTLSEYQNADNWKSFVNLMEKEYDDVTIPEKKQCATPSITFENGTIHFNCETEGAEFESEIKCKDVNTYSTRDINISATYEINVYAKANGYVNSEEVNATLCWIDAEPKTEGLSNGVAEVRAKAVLIKSNEGKLTVEGIEDGQTVEIYSLNGEKRGSAVGKSGTAYIDSYIKPGSVVVVKMRDKSVKVIVK